MRKFKILCAIEISVILGGCLIVAPLGMWWARGNEIVIGLIGVGGFIAIMASLVVWFILAQKCDGNS